MDRYYDFCRFIDEKGLSLWQSWDAGIDYTQALSPSQVPLGHVGIDINSLSANVMAFISLLRNVAQLLLETFGHFFYLLGHITQTLQ